MDWFGATPAAAELPIDLPLTSPVPAQASEPDSPRPEWARPEAVDSQPEPRSIAAAASSEAVVSLAPLQSPPAKLPPPATLPPLADAFAAILAAEQHEPMPALQLAWPALAASSNGGGSLSEEAIEAITRRVLARLSNGVVRATVTDVVSGIAERLVREEIERIKSSIK